MKKLFLLYFFIGFIYMEAYPCLNYYYLLDNEGHFHEQPGGFNHFNINFNTEKIVGKLHQLEKKLAKEHNYTVLSDYAVGLMKLGKTEEARDLLQVLYRHYPDQYQLASNLGTAFELTGEVDSALVYIRRGIELNPKDHEGSEWIHIKVLETKLKLKKDPAYLDTHSVLELTKEQEKDPAVLQQIEIQVRERFPFSPGPDPIMASLMEDLGDTYAEGYSIEYAQAFYEMAKEYYGGPSDRLVKKIAGIKTLKKKYANKQLENSTILKDGTANRLGGVSYKHLMDDNDPNHYQVDWEKTNADVTALLAYADLKKTTEEVQTEDKNSTDSLHLVENKTEITTPGTVKKSWNTIVKHRKLAILTLVISGLVIIFGGYFFFKKKKSS